MTRYVSASGTGQMKYLHNTFHNMDIELSFLRGKEGVPSFVTPWIKKQSNQLNYY
jgi:hypothetical protein